MRNLEKEIRMTDETEDEMMIEEGMMTGEEMMEEENEKGKGMTDLERENVTEKDEGMRKRMIGKKALDKILLQLQVQLPLLLPLLYNNDVEVFSYCNKHYS